MPDQLPKAIVRGDFPPPPDLGPTEPPPGAVAIPLHRLHTPGQIAVATFLGSPIAGCWLLGRNFKRLQRPSAAWLSLGVGVLCTAVLVWIGIYVSQFRFVSFLPVFGMRALAQATQGDDLESHRRRGGAIASWGVTVGLSVASLALALALIFGAALGYAALAASPRIAVGHGEVFYDDDATEAEARAVGAYLNELGYFEHEASVKLQRDRGRFVVSFVVVASAFHDKAIHDEFLAISDKLSKAALAGAPVDIVLTDDHLEPKAQLVWEARTQHIAIGDGEVAFRTGVSESEARAVGRLLLDRKALGGSVIIKRSPAGRVVVAFTIREYDPSLEKQVHPLASALSKGAFAGSPVDLAVIDGSGAEHVLAWESRPNDPIEIGRHTLMYRNGITEPQARAVGAAVQALFAAIERSTEMGLERDSEGRAVLELDALAFESPAQKLALHRQAQTISDHAFAGAPVDVVLVDEDGTIVVRLSWETRPNKPARKR